MYYTPVHIIQAVHRRFPDRDFVDICSSSDANVRVQAKYWSDNYECFDFAELPASTSVFANPPYHRGFMLPFIQYLVKYAYDRDTVLLVNSETSTKWFGMALRYFDHLVILNGRLSFFDSESQSIANSNRYDSVIFTKGAYPHQFADLGVVVSKT